MCIEFYASQTSIEIDAAMEFRTGESFGNKITRKRAMKCDKSSTIRWDGHFMFAGLQQLIFLFMHFYLILNRRHRFDTEIQESQ